MRTQKAILLTILGALGSIMSAQVSAAQVEVFDRATGQVLPTYRHNGMTYIAGEVGHEYELRIRNRMGQRMLAVATIDGVNVITGQTGAVDQAGYVLDAYGYARIEGWRKSMSRTAAFYFTKLPDSYAARTGRPNNVGVIGVALFRERVRCCLREKYSSREDVSPSAPEAASSRAADSERGDRARQAESKLGTGHGRSEHSAAEYTEFERASDQPDEIISIYYDSRRNLLAQGIIPTPQRYSQRKPQPFPSGFTPDP